MKLRADRRLGEMLSPEQIEREKGGRPENSLHHAMSLTKYQQTLRDNSIEPTAAHRWQKESLIPIEIFEQYLAEAKEKQVEITTKALLDYYKKLQWEEHKRQMLAEYGERARAFSDENIEVYIGDFQDHIEKVTDILDDSVDCIFTDPPYPAEYLPLWSSLSSLAARVLVPGGFCVSYSGVYHLNKVMQLLGEKLDYYWQAILLHNAQFQLIRGRNIKTGYKPILLYAKPPIDIWEQYKEDIILGTGREKELHEWAQAEGEAITIIERFTDPGDIVLDPMAGSGTVLVACKATNRRAIGIEIDANNVSIIKGRLSSVNNKPMG